MGGGVPPPTPYHWQAVEAGDGLSGWAPDAMTVEEQAAQGTR